MTATSGLITLSGDGPLTADGPMLVMVQQTFTDYWNSSCAADDLASAIERGAAGATSNPSIVFEVLRREAGYRLPRVRQVAAATPAWNETDHAVRFGTLAPDIQIRSAATNAGITGLEEATA